LRGKQIERLRNPGLSASIVINEAILQEIVVVRRREKRKRLHQTNWEKGARIR